jgi:hypothetical protein
MQCSKGCVHGLELKRWAMWAAATRVFIVGKLFPCHSCRHVALRLLLLLVLLHCMCIR